MSDKDPSLRRNAPKLALHVPEPKFRPGDTPDFSNLKIPAAGSAPRPDTSAAATETHPLTTSLVRVLGDDNRATGPWDPKLDADTLRKILRDIMRRAGIMHELNRRRMDATCALVLEQRRSTFQ